MVNRKNAHSNEGAGSECSFLYPTINFNFLNYIVG